MDRQRKILIGLLVLIIAVILFSGQMGKKIDWRETYLKKHKIPYGTYIVYNELPSFFPESKIKTVDISPYMFLRKEDKNGTYIFINSSIDIGKEELEKLKDFVDKGNDVFIADHDFILDSLGFRTNYFSAMRFGNSLSFKLVNKAFGDNKYYFKRNFPTKVFEKIDTQNTVVLGTMSYESGDGETVTTGVNFVKFKYGKGNFYFHTIPEIFTNYFVLDSANSDYTAGVLTYLDNPETIFWDSYFKNGRAKIQSPLHYIFSNPSLKWAYYLLILGTIVFIIFEGRRKQRPIAVSQPNKNLSLQFTRTIANMYYETSNHKKIAELKIQFLLDYIRTYFMLDTQNPDAGFYVNLAAKSNKNVDEIKKMFSYFERLKNKNIVTKEELVDLEKIIEKFK